jgi:pyruvate dehydrogenase E2 component (dihydrolipoamide acetyltransferase)
MSDTTNDSGTEKIILETRAYVGLRKTIGERMKESLLRSPQGTMTTRADMTQAIAFKKQLEEKGQKVSLTDILVKAVALAIRQNPIINSSIEDNRIVIYKSINIGVAVGTEKGLFVPIIHHVEEKSLLQVAAELKELAQMVNEKRITLKDLSGGTFTISNMGMYDVDIVTAIINPPEAAILAVGATRKEVVVEEDGSTVIKPMTTLSLTADHAIIDGIPAVKFLKDIKSILNNPTLLLDTSTDCQ